MKLSIVIPVLNEEQVIPELYRRISIALIRDFKKWDYEIVFVDDGSIDSSFNILKKLHKNNKKIKVLQFSRNFGQHTAISAGLKIVKGNFIVIMDADLQDRPEEIINLYKKLTQGFNLVYSVRQNKISPSFKNLSSRLFWYLIKYLTGLDIPPNQSMLKIFDKKVLLAINQLEDSNPFYPAMFSIIGFKQTTKAVKIDKRFGGKTKYSIKKMLQLAINAIFGYAYKRLSFIYFSLIFTTTLFIIVFALFSNRLFFMSTENQLLIILITLIFLIFLSIFYINISYYYFSKVFRNISKTPNFIISNKLT